ncbi:g8240 [Coccomyxa viridis]|uniref:G8240 protein n=1 Tax=Coccomyxa viridis TaxID=1274662 RepID=A0ABP1FZW8_9CHLO
MATVPKEHIAGRAARFTYDSIVDRDLIVLADDVASLPEPPKQSQKSQEERAADAIQKMSNLLGKSHLTRLFALQGLRIDESTAMYYLKESGGDLKRAVRMYEADKTWERRP